MSESLTLARRGEMARRPLRLTARGRLHRTLLAGCLLVGITAAMALAGVLAPPYDPLAMDIPARLRPPGPAHWCGTDQYGRDILSRILGGGSLALSVGLAAVGIGVGVGASLGLLAGFYGGWFEEVLMRVMDALLAFPAILLAIAIVAVLGPGEANAMLAIGIVNVPIFARLARSSALSLKALGYVEAARAIGGSDLHILRRHILPNSLPPLLVQASVSFASALLAEASLSYLGLGAQPPAPSWGRMLYEARGFMEQAPWAAFFPGLALALAVLGFNFLSDGLRDLLDPRR